MIVEKIEAELGIILPDVRNQYVNKRPLVRWHVGVEEGDDLAKVKKFLEENVLLHMAELEHRITQAMHYEARQLAHSETQGVIFKTTYASDTLNTPNHPPPPEDLEEQIESYDPGDLLTGGAKPEQPEAPNLYAPETGSVAHAEGVRKPPRPPE